MASSSSKKIEEGKASVMDLGNGSKVLYIPRLVALETAWKWFNYLDKRLPWIRPSIPASGRTIRQPRDVCYIADKRTTAYKYSGFQPRAHSWEEFPLLEEILSKVREAIPGSQFNSVLLNRYQTGSDSVSWHADNEALYGETPEIASLTLGGEREFLLRRAPTKSKDVVESEGSAKKRLKMTAPQQLHSFVLKHGSLLVMRGYTQRDWQHSVPKTSKASAPRINLTFRYVLS